MDFTGKHQCCTSEPAAQASASYVDTAGYSHVLDLLLDHFGKPFRVRRGARGLVTTPILALAGNMADIGGPLLGPPLRLPHRGARVTRHHASPPPHPPGTCRLAQAPAESPAA